MKQYNLPQREVSRRVASGIFAAVLLSLSYYNATAQQIVSPSQFTADFEFMWTGLRDHYAYFDKKDIDWNAVAELYRPGLADVKSKQDFISLLERVLNELYDDHLSLNTNLRTSPRLVPTGLDIWAEWTNGHAVITEVRRGFSAEQAGLTVGMEIVSIDGRPIRDAAAHRLPRTLHVARADAWNWALRAVLAGTHDQPNDS